MDKTKTVIEWDYATAYELFLSLSVLHEPDYYGIRASWAAGIRSRIPAPERKLLEEVIPYLGAPLLWVRNLPAPKDSLPALRAIEQIPPAERLGSLFRWQCAEEDPLCQTMQRIMENHAWQESDLHILQEKWEGKERKPAQPNALQRYLDWWTRPEEFGEAYLSALQAYYTAFFAEEEKRIDPVLRAGLAKAQNLAQTLPLNELMTELSQGLHFEEKEQPPSILFAPVYWTTPLVALLYQKDSLLFLFGARPPEMSAIPGELVPDSLLRSLKALADPTRLKILHYLTQEEMTPSALARRLNLRAPTVTHHLAELRRAGLVNLTLRGQEKLYRTRREALPHLHTALEHFLAGKDA